MSVTGSPTVSVVIPCHNSAAFVRDTVESVMAQTLHEREVVFVDDGSVDDTRSVIEQLMAKQGDCPMTLLSQVNAGVASARNRGISAARGRYILPVDADDLIAPTMLETCAHVLDEQRQTALVFTDRRDFGAMEGLVPAGRFELGRLKYFNQIPYCSMYRRELWEAIGGYRLNVSGFDDWDFWLAAAARGFCGHHIPQAMLQHRRRRDSQLVTIMGDYERLYANIILNNREVYAESEIAAAHGYLSQGKAGAPSAAE
jgi:glycosyltransferase involved in cell wall biosynthesis